MQNRSTRVYVRTCVQCSTGILEYTFDTGMAILQYYIVEDK